MPLDLADYEAKAKEAVKAFWGNRAAVAKQKELGREDEGERAAVTRRQEYGRIHRPHSARDPRRRLDGRPYDDGAACPHPARILPSDKALGPADPQSRPPRSGHRAEIPGRAIIIAAQREKTKKTPL